MYSISFKMEQERLQGIENYLRRGEYPAGTEKKDKPNFRRRYRNNYKFEGGILYYKKCSGKRLQQAQTNSQELQNGGCVSGVRRKRGSWSHAMGEQLHGGHFGRDKTLEKICSRFHWRNMVEEIREYVKKCPQCQRMNANFIKPNTGPM